jgi:hypothetical protein
MERLNMRPRQLRVCRHPRRGLRAAGLIAVAALAPISLSCPARRRTAKLGRALAEVVHGLGALLAWVRSCGAVLPELTSIAPGEALRRTALILAASLAMVVLLSTIDSGLLRLYLAGSARRLA